MKLEKLTYSEFETLPNEWSTSDCTFGQTNLIVGKNATGKTRMLNVIRGVMGLISDSNILEIGEGKYSIEISNGERVFSYFLEHHSKTVYSEELKINGDVFLSRAEDGTGKIKAIEIGRDIPFKIETNRLAVVAKRDSIQHPYIDDLYQWAQGVTKLNFGSELGKNILAIKASEESKEVISVRDTEKVVGLFNQGKSKLGEIFTTAIIEDMKYIGYNIEKVGVDILEHISIIPLPSGLYVKESDLQMKTSQLEMSQGMFRALSVLIQFNYGILSNETSCLLIDDIGEGLDYSRSSSLVKLLIEKAKNSALQLIMTTNDRFIMNAVPLEYWIILLRDGGRVSSLNYRNSKEMFDKFEVTGLNNFDLFSSGYYKNP